MEHAETATQVATPPDRSAQEMVGAEGFEPPTSGRERLGRRWLKTDETLRASRKLLVEHFEKACDGIRDRPIPARKTTINRPIELRRAGRCSTRLCGVGPKTGTYAGACVPLRVLVAHRGQRGGPAHSGNGGVTCLLRENVQLDATLGIGASDDADDWFLGVGVSVLFPD